MSGTNGRGFVEGRQFYLDLCLSEGAKFFGDGGIIKCHWDDEATSTAMEGRKLVIGLSVKVAPSNTTSITNQ